MDLKTYWQSLGPAAKKTFAQRVGANQVYLTQLVAGIRKYPKAALAIAIERESLGAVTVEELDPRPDWAYIRGTFRARKLAEQRRQKDAPVEAQPVPAGEPAVPSDGEGGSHAEAA